MYQWFRGRRTTQTRGPWEKSSPMWFHIRAANACGLFRFLSEMDNIMQTLREYPFCLLLHILMKKKKVGWKHSVLANQTRAAFAFPVSALIPCGLRRTSRAGHLWSESEKEDWKAMSLFLLQRKKTTIIQNQPKTRVSYFLICPSPWCASDSTELLSLTLFSHLLPELLWCYIIWTNPGLFHFF